MPTLNIEGRTVNVGDEFLKLSPSEQNAAVDEIAASLGVKASGQDNAALSADNLVRSAAQGIPIVGGAVDKFAAGMDALTQPLLGRGSSAGSIGERYAANLANETGHTAQFEAAHPVASTVAGLAGGIAATAPIAATAMGARAFGFGGGPLLENAARGAATGAGIGAADSAIRGGDPVTGAAIGGFTGGAAPVVGRAMGKVAQALTPTPTQTVAANKVAAPLLREGINTPEALQARLNSIGPEAMLVDAHPDLTQMGGAIASTPGPGQQTLRTALSSRGATAGERIISDLDKTMGEPVDLDKLARSIHASAQAEAGPLYAQGYRAPVANTPEIEAVLNSPFGKQAITKARQLALSDTKAAPSVMFAQDGSRAPQPVLPEWAQSVLARGGNGAANLQAALHESGVSVPGAAGLSSVDARGLHLVRQAFDDMINNAKGSGATNRVRILTNNRNAIDNALKQIEPIAQADAIYSDKSTIQKAMADGMQIFKSSQTPESVAAALAKYTGAAGEGYLQGARVAIRNVMGTARSDAAGARSMLSKGFNQEKLNVLLGPDDAAAVLKRIGAETSYTNNSSRILANSETAARLQGKADLNGASGMPSLKETAIYSGTHGLARRAAVAAFEKAYGAIASGRQREIESSIADLLTAQGVKRTEAVQQLMGVAFKQDPTGNTNRLISQVAARLPQAAGPRDQSNRQRQ